MFIVDFKNQCLFCSRYYSQENSFLIYNAVKGAWKKIENKFTGTNSTLPWSWINFNILENAKHVSVFMTAYPTPYLPVPLFGSTTLASC